MILDTKDKKFYYKDSKKYKNTIDKMKIFWYSNTRP